MRLTVPTLLSVVLLVAALGLGVPRAAWAQVGGFVGLNSTNVTINYTSHGDPSNYSNARRSGFVGGVTFNVPVRDMFSVEVDALYAEKGTQISREEFIRLNYVDIPVLGRLNMRGPGPTRVHLLVGPSLNLTVSDNLGDEEAVTSGFEAAVVVGGGVTVTRFRVDVRYGLGLSNTLKDSDDAVARNRVFSILVGFAVR